MPTVILAKHGRALTDLLVTAPWWVVFVRGAGDPGCVYGGPPWTVSRWLAEHALAFGPPVEAVGYPFQTASESLEARVRIERGCTPHRLAAA